MRIRLFDQMIARRRYFRLARSSTHWLDELATTPLDDPEERGLLYYLLAADEEQRVRLHDTAFGPSSPDGPNDDHCCHPVEIAASAALLRLLTAVEDWIAEGPTEAGLLPWAGITDHPQIEQAAAPVLSLMVAEPHRRDDLLADLAVALWDVMPGQSLETVACMVPRHTLCARIAQAAGQPAASPTSP
jgi:hypothetical protein